MGSGTALPVRPADHFAHSRRRIENNQKTLDTIVGSLLPSTAAWTKSTDRAISAG
jgi:hypothetical protein